MGLVLPDTAIANRRILYACCLADYEARAMRCEEFGDEACAREWKDKAAMMRAGLLVMHGAPLSTESALDKCYTHEDACVAMSRFDRFCISCGCHEPAAPAPPDPPDCTVVPDITANVAIDGPDLVATQAANETEGFVIFIATNTAGSGNSPNQTATYSGGSWQYATAPDGSVVLDSSTGTYWIAHPYPTWPAPMFPAISGQNNGGGNYTIVSEYPAQAAGSLRQVVVQMSTDGNTWVTVYTGQESALATDYSLVLPQDAYTLTRVSYLYGGCTYQYYGGIITGNNPPASAFSLQGPVFLEIGGPGSMSPQSPGELFNAMHQGWTVSFRVQWDNTNPPDGSIPGFSFQMASLLSEWGLTISVDPLSGIVEIFGSVQEVLGPNKLTATLPSIVGPAGDGQWRHFAIVRDPSADDDWSPSAVKLYVNGVDVPLTQTITTPYSPAQGTELQELVFISAAPSAANNRVWIDEIYGCDHPATAAEVATVLYPNLMNTFDAAWGRQFWYRIESVDGGTQFIQNFVTPAKTKLGNTVGINQLSPNVDPSI